MSADFAPRRAMLRQPLTALVRTLATHRPLLMHLGRTAPEPQRRTRIEQANLVYHTIRLAYRGRRLTVGVLA